MEPGDPAHSGLSGGGGGVGKKGRTDGVAWRGGLAEGQGVPGKTQGQGRPWGTIPALMENFPDAGEYRGGQRHRGALGHVMNEPRDVGQTVGCSLAPFILLNCALTALHPLHRR